MSALSPRQRLRYLAHLYKAVVKQHHRDLVPLLARHVPRDGVVIDVGAHAGQFTKLFARLAPAGTVCALEPGSYARGVLERAVRFRRLANVRVRAVGLSDAAGTADLAMPVKAGGSLGFGLSHLGAPDTRRGHRAEVIALTTLDALVMAEGLTRLDLVKADIEGWEVRMLRGGSGTLQRFRPALLLELVASHLARAGDRPDDAWALLAPLGYRARRLRGGTPTPVAAFAGDGDYLFAAPPR